MKQDKNLKLNYISEFKNKAIEEEYLQKYIDSCRKNLGRLIMLIGFIFFAISFVDLLTEKNSEIFVLNIFIRSIIFILALITGIYVIKGKKTKYTLYAIMIFSLSLILSYQWILYLYKAQDFLQQGIAYVVIVFAIYLIPNRWVYAVGLSVSIVALFLITAPFYIEDLLFSQVLNVFVYFITSIIIASIHSYNLSKYRHLQFFREQQLEHLSITDSLTGIYNRQKFDEIFKKMFQMVAEEKSTFSIIMFDLDDFKKINDDYGHIIGDKVLVACAAEVRKSMRAHEMLARWGGEEFVILAPQAKIEEASILAERLRKIIEKLVVEDSIRFTASFGLTSYKEEDTMDSVLIRVDSCLYLAKANGKNCVYTQ